MEVPTDRKLKTAGFLDAVLLTEPLRDPDRLKPKDWRAWAAIREIFSEIHLYREHMGKVVELNSNYRDADSFLERMSQRFEKETNHLQAIRTDLSASC
jgi:hypothetical protein